jgi:hypothetical protein
VAIATSCRPPPTNFAGARGQRRVAIEIPVYAITFLDEDRVTRFEAFDSDQRALALARFDELSRPA